MQGCNVILVTAEYLEYAPTILEVDAHHESDLERFKAFIFNSLIAIKEYGNAAHLQFLLDNNMFHGADADAGYIDGLLETCPFFKILYETLISLEYAPSESVSLLLHTLNGYYVDLLTGDLILDVPNNITTYAFGC